MGSDRRSALSSSSYNTVSSDEEVTEEDRDRAGVEVGDALALTDRALASLWE